MFRLFCVSGIFRRGLTSSQGNVDYLSCSIIRHTHFCHLSPPSPRLQRVAQTLAQTLRSARQSRSWFQIAKPKCSTSPHRVLVVSFGASLSVGILGLAKLHRADCEGRRAKRNRLVGARDDSKGQEPLFPWSEFFKLLAPDVWYLIGAVITALAAAFVNIQIPLMLGDVVNVVSKYTADTVGSFMEDIREPATRLVGMYLIQGALTFSYITLLSHAGERMAARLRKDLFQSILAQDISFFDQHKTGEIINRLTTDVQDFKSSFKLCISQGLRSITQVIGCAGSLMIISPKLTTLLLVVVPAIILTGSGIGSLLRKLSRMAQAQVATSTGVADEAIGNVRTVRAFAMEEKEMELFNQEVEKSEWLNKLLGVGIGAFQGLSNLALNGIMLGTLYVGGSLMADGTLRAGDLMSFVIATQTVQRSLAQMSLLFGQAVRGFSAGARVFEYMQLTPTMPLSGGVRVPYHTMHGDVMFEGVSFSYPTRSDQLVLKNFNLKLPAGRMVALCGLSGGGKSTIASLIERFYDVTSGRITIDGHDVTDLDPQWLRGRAIGYINQEPVLFATSIRENIRYGKPDATDQEVVEAARLANAHDFISGFPEGYGTVLGERGVTVSGGQKQRIAIARALIKNPSILILDEATSALDAESERVVQAALDNVVKGRTVLVIAHRLSTIRNADVIAVIANGTIAEMGTHDELRKKRGIYWNLIRQQETEEGATAVKSNRFWGK